MEEMRTESSRVRLFVALNLPEGVRSALGAWGKQALSDPALRRVPAENLHITLAFLGQRPEEEIERIAAIVGESVGPAPLVELLDPVQRPPRGRTRLFALPAVSPGAEILQAGLQERLLAAGLYEPEKRAFWPHLTLARVRGEGRGSRRPMAVRNPPKDLPRILEEAFYGVRMTLYRSVLQPSGARYVPLAQIELPGGAAVR
jgi:2'-5' RNA ligase